MSAEYSKSTRSGSKSRILSIDALRGFDMFWIIGAEKLFYGLALIWPIAIWQSLAQQMQHSEWHGFTAYDLIFPLFIFISGVSVGISRTDLAGKPWKDKQPYAIKLIKRVLLLCLLGVVYNHGWGKGIPLSWDAIRYTSVLAKIAIAWGITAWLVWHFSLQKLIIILGVGLVGYALLQAFVCIGSDGFGNDFAHYGCGDYSEAYSINAWVDQSFLPGQFYQSDTLDPEGLLAHIGSIFTALAGAIIGRLTYVRLSSSLLRLRFMLITAGSCLLAGFIISFIIPINKALWTLPFNLLSIGYSCLLLAIFYWLFDVLQWRKLAVFFAVIGANAIAIYLSTALFDWHYIVNSLISGLLASIPEHYQLITSTVALLLIQWWVLYLSYKRKIFIKV